MDHILTLTTLIYKYLDSNPTRRLFASFVDFKSAYDTVWRKALLYKLSNMNIKGNFLQLLDSMYSDVRYRIKLNGALSPEIKSEIGLKQGGVLSPSLFNLFLADLPAIFDASCDPVLLNNRRLSCLMYADDLILLSESHTGLQNSLNALHSYCMKWNLTVNLKKSQVMIFNKPGHLLKNYRFKYGNLNLDIVREYTYLGIIFTPSGSFTRAISELATKARKAYFAFRKHDRSPAKISQQFFDTLVKPILLYGCEAWTIFHSPKLSKINFVKQADDVIYERLNLKFCRSILGVHKKATNLAARGELGRYPLLLSALDLSMRYLSRVHFLSHKNTRITPLICDAYIEALKDSPKPSWAILLKNLPAKLEIPMNLFDLKSLHRMYDRLWASELRTRGENGKLEILSKLSTEFGRATYVDSLPPGLRKYLARVRISAHSFEVEILRYRRNPQIPRAQRFCKFCDLQAIGDEVHAILQCPLLAHERAAYLSSVGLEDAPPNLDTLVTMLGNEERDFMFKTARFIELIYDRRNLLLHSIPVVFREAVTTRSGRVSRPPDYLQVTH